MHKQNKNIKMTFNGKVDKLKTSKSVPGLQLWQYNRNTELKCLEKGILPWTTSFK